MSIFKYHVFAPIRQHGPTPRRATFNPPLRTPLPPGRAVCKVGPAAGGGAAPPSRFAPPPRRPCPRGGAASARAARGERGEGHSRGPRSAHRRDASARSGARIEGGFWKGWNRISTSVGTRLSLKGTCSSSPLVGRGTQRVLSSSGEWLTRCTFSSTSDELFLLPRNIDVQIGVRQLCKMTPHSF